MASKLGNGKLRKDQTDHYGRIKNQGGGGATVDDFVDSEDITFSEDETTEKIKAELTDDIKTILENALTDSDLEDSETINIDTDEETGKLNFNLDATLVTKVDNSLQTPLQTPIATELVGVDSSKSQVRITLDSDTLELDEDNVLKVKSGGGGLTFDDIYPVGSVYSTIDEDIDPSNLFGGTWILIANSIVTTIDENVYGNGKTLGLTDATYLGGAGSSSGNTKAMRVVSPLYGTNVGTNLSSDDYLNGKSLGIPTKVQLGNNPEYSGLVVDRNQETVYIWKRTV